MNVCVEGFELGYLVIMGTMVDMLMLPLGRTLLAVIKVSLFVVLVFIIKMVLQKGRFVYSLNW